ncbi:phosphatidate cytidylyltransferase [Pelagibacterales bacterium SAG-MED41]|nr:phosphatidate cytidylyltransferase [Pelagibacterales bacterium SAG-MED41]|tara:strand:- start:565 stop:1212 length:648 start_codon:yes stop_codon:yes gene_type:complete
MNKYLKQRIYTSILLLILLFLISKLNSLLIFCLLILGVLSQLEFLNLAKKLFKNKIFFILSNLFFLFYIFTFCYLFLFFSSIFQLKLILFSLLFCCIASDVGGFVFGKIFKGPKLTKISPNKTYSGSLGSIFLSILVFSISIYYFFNEVSISMIIISIITSIGCQIGDLFFSYLKRKVKMKDTGNVLPGHGGVLDRLDGIFLGIPLGFACLTLIH